MTRRAVAPIVLVVGTGIVITVLGSSWEHAAMLVAVLVAGVVLWFGTEYAGRSTWPRPPDLARDGARRDVSELGWAILGRDGRASPRAARRVLDLADRQLARHGVTGGLAAPDTVVPASRLLGARTAQGLHAVATSSSLPTPRELQTWIESVERLADTPPDEGTPR